MVKSMADRVEFAAIDAPFPYSPSLRPADSSSSKAMAPEATLPIDPDSPVSPSLLPADSSRKGESVRDDAGE